MMKQIELPYHFNALEPHIDELTMLTHYTKHHATYTANLNTALEKLPEFSGTGIEELLVRLSDISDDALRTAVRNNGGGFYNHNLYFDTLTPGGSNQPSGELAKQIALVYGDYPSLKERLSTAAIGRFGSGWAWLSANRSGALQISSSPNQDNPILESYGEWIPILGIDVWEHAYYLNYKNLRADYIKAFFELINWDVVAKHYSEVIASRQ